MRCVEHRHAGARKVLPNVVRVVVVSDMLSHATSERLQTEHHQ